MKIENTSEYGHVLQRILLTMNPTSIPANPLTPQILISHCKEVSYRPIEEKSLTYLRSVETWSMIYNV